MNPDNLSNTLVGKDWANPKAVNYPKVNKQCVKSIVQINKEAAKVRRVIEEVE